MTESTQPNPLSAFFAAACSFERDGGTEESERIVHKHPEIATDIAVAAVRGDTASLVAGLIASASGLSASFGIPGRSKESKESKDAAKPDSTPPALRTYEPGGFTPLLYCCLSNYARSGHEQCKEVVSAAEVLVKAGADPNAAAHPNPFDPRKTVRPLFGAAVVLANKELIQILLDGGAQPLAGEELAQVAKQENPDCWNLLMEHGDVDAVAESFAADAETALHAALDRIYSEELLRFLLHRGANLEKQSEPGSETALHIATRRRRLEAVRILADQGAKLNAETAGGKTAYAHAIRRGFVEISDELRIRGCSTKLNPADELAVALVGGDLEEARSLLSHQSDLVKEMSAEEARILPDLTGRQALDPVRFLLENGVDLNARGLDDGTALHQAAWFGQPGQVDLLLSFQHPIDPVDRVHRFTPLGWCAHGSSFSGDAQSRQNDYARIARTLLEAGATLAHPIETDPDPHGNWLLREASPEVAEVLREFGAGNG